MTLRQTVELARGGQNVAAVVPLANQGPNVFASLVDRLPDDVETTVRRGDLVIDFPTSGGRARVLRDVRGSELHAVAVAAPWEAIAPALVSTAGQVLGP